MGRKVIAFWLSLSMMVSFVVIVDVTMDFTINVGGTTLYVNTTGSGGAYTKIQDAINAANPGNTVYVYNGTYYENVVVNKTVNLTGEDKNTTIIDGGGSGDVIYGNSIWVNITGFTITGSGSDTGNCGFDLLYVENCTVKNNKIINNNWSGIHLHSSSNNKIIGNYFSNNSLYNIKLYLTSYTDIHDNEISNRTFIGIHIHTTTYNNITGNNFYNNGISLFGQNLEQFNSHEITTDNLVNGKPFYFYKDSSGIDVDGIPVGQLIIVNCVNCIVKNLIINNTDVGIIIAHSSNINMENNTVRDNVKGVHFFVSTDCTISNNTMSSNKGEGLYFYSSSGCDIVSNTIKSNDYYGIYAYSSSNTFTGNTISMNNGYGVYLPSSSSNNKLYHNNIIYNTIQALDETSNGNQWDDGYPSGGNYWSNYTGIDLNSTSAQNVPPPDGIGDTKYYIDSNSKDNYPLMKPYYPNENYLILKQGWNLISLPFIQLDQNLTNVLKSIDGLYNTVQWYDPLDANDPWKHYRIGKYFGNDLSEIDETKGLWVHITNPGDTIFLYQGAEPTQNQTISLYSGWNLVGYPSLKSYNRTEGLNNLTFDTHVDSIWTYNAAAQKWQEIREQDYFKVGKGYWVHAKTDCVWDVPL